MKPDPVWNATLIELTRRSEHLRHRSYAELASLPSHLDEDVMIEGTPITYVTYRVTNPAGELLVVVQANREGRRVLLIQTGQCYAEGFRMRPNGAITLVPERELYADYI